MNLTIRNKNLKGIIALAQVFQQKGVIYINECINMINYMAKTTNIKKIAISVMDPIFNIVSRDQFKKTCNTNLNDVTIIISPAKIITREEESTQSI